MTSSQQRTPRGINREVLPAILSALLRNLQLGQKLQPHRFETKIAILKFL